MDRVLRAFLEALEEVAKEHEEIFDTAVREQMVAALIHVFIAPKTGYTLPKAFGMFSPAGNEAVHKALKFFLPKLVEAAALNGLTTPGQRLNALQNDEVETSEGNYHDDFLGYVDPDSTPWDAAGS